MFLALNHHFLTFCGIPDQWSTAGPQKEGHPQRPGRPPSAAERHRTRRRKRRRGRRGRRNGGGGGRGIYALGCQLSGFHVLHSGKSWKIMENPHVFLWEKPTISIWPFSIANYVSTRGYREWPILGVFEVSQGVSQFGIAGCVGCENYGVAKIR